VGLNPSGGASMANDKHVERLMCDLRIEKQDSSSAKTMIGRDAQED